MISYIGPVKSKIDLEKSLKLAVKIFKKNNKNINYKNKSYIWNNNENIKLKNIIIIKNKKGTVIGLTRIIPKRLKLNNNSFNVSGLSSICIDYNYQSRGISKILINYVLEYCKKNKFDLVVLFSRRLLDHYYNKFGIYGISHYSSLKLKPNDLSKYHKTKYLLKNAKISDINKIQKSYNYTYLKCNGVFYRNYFFWKNLFKRNKLEKNKIELLTENNRFFGYLIRNKNHIFEVGILPKTNLNKLLKTINFNKQNTEIDIIQNHPILNYINSSDFTISFRQCHYGGHMLKIININKIKKYSKNKFNNTELSKINKNKIDFELTMKLLGLTDFSKFSKVHQNFSYFSFLKSDHL